MDFLLTFAGATGLSALFAQSKPLPSEAEAVKAWEKLQKTPDDPEANLIAGKWKAFVLGDYPEGMGYLAKSSDKNLKTLAEHELDPAYTTTALQKAAMGDEWVAAAKKFPVLFRIFFDRAQHWYVEAWPGLDAASKPKYREQGRKLAAAKPPGGARKGLPKGWKEDMASAGARSPELDGTIARTGSYSIKMIPGDPKVANSSGILRSDSIPATGKKLELSAYVRSDGTDNPSDQVFVSFFDKNGMATGTWGPLVKTDTPFWQWASIKMDIPDNIGIIQIGVFFRSKTGFMWLDDVSLKIDGTEALKNTSFEER